MVAELLIDRNEKKRTFTITTDSHSTLAILLGRLLQYDDTKSISIRMNEVERKLDEEQIEKLTDVEPNKIEE